MSTARHHAEWLSLVETSGPFLSMPVLMRVFPQELDGRNAARAARLREAYGDWLERGQKNVAVHQAWVKHVLTDLLEYPANLLVEGQAIPPGLEAVIPQHGETLRPDLVLKHQHTAEKPPLLITVYPPRQVLDKPVSGRSTWNASPGTRMMELLHGCDLPLGLVTNGEEWMLVHAPRGETTGFASWFADLWMQEPITLRAFHSLLHLRRLIGVARSDTLAAIYAESAKDQQEVTDQLGRQVREAVEVLVQAFDRIDAESGRQLLAGVEEKELYNAALTVMMRLVFLFSAEERDLLPLSDRFYEEHYAASSLRAQLRERADQHGEEVLERRHDAWTRLLATFRSVHSGVQHDRLHLPPYGGSLFDPDRYPFLEGRKLGSRWRDTPAKPLPINNRVVLHLLAALQELRVRVAGGGPAEKRRLSFRALDIEQIGHVYEGLLDHTARRADGIVLGLAGKNDAAVTLAELERKAKAGRDELVEFLSESTGRSISAIRKGLDADEVDELSLQHAAGNDGKLVNRVRPFAALLRGDSFGQPQIVLPGSVYVTAGTDRRSSGTHYTPRTLTEPIVQHTLEPLVFHGPAEGAPREKWKLKTPREILARKVCDMAMGSGAFLVQACRYLAERLVEAWDAAEREHPGEVIVTPEGELSAATPSERLLPKEPAERIAMARRYVADRCLYGVDINPMAVEMAKLSLWLITVQRDRPFTFLDHALKCGDSLLGVSSLKQLENFSLRPGERQMAFATASLLRLVNEASAKRAALENLPSNDSSQIETKNRLHAEAEAATAEVKALADALIGFELRGFEGDAYEEQRAEEADKVQLLMRRDPAASADPPQLFIHARAQLRGRIPFHWGLEFPEVFSRGGFDAFTGNPPFMSGSRISTRVGDDFYQCIKIIYPSSRGQTDLCAFFFLRAFDLVCTGGNAGLIATNTISQGDTQAAGLGHILAQGGVIYRANVSQTWPGVAAVVVSVVHVHKGAYAGDCVLNGVSTKRISGFLDSVVGDDVAHRLADNVGKAFSGTYILGEGFVISPEEARALIDSDPRNSQVLFPILGGQDFNSRSDQSPSRYVINFFDWPLEKAKTYRHCFKIVEERVYPERQKNSEAKYRKYWWQYKRPTFELYELVRKLPRVLFHGFTSRHLCFDFVPTNLIYAGPHIVIALSDEGSFGVLQSSFHDSWVWKYCSTMKTDIRYAPSDLFDTFPFPENEQEVSSSAETYRKFRKDIMISRNEGLTATYNRFHDRGEQAADIARLRTLHAKMDQAVAAAYRWTDFDLGHGFHKTKQGERYTISERARRTVLDRLLALNHDRYSEELKSGSQETKTDKKKKPTAPRIGKSATQFDGDRLLPSGFRFPASEPALYAVNLIVTLLSESGGSLRWQQLRDAFVLATRPRLLEDHAPGRYRLAAKEWAERWNESATPKLLPTSLRALGAKNLFVEKQDTDFVIQLADGPKPAANEDIAFDAWLALRVAAEIKSDTFPVPDEVKPAVEEVRALALAKR